MSDMEFATSEWWTAYKETVNQDDEMQVRGHDTFDVNFYLAIGDDRVLIEMDNGTIAAITEDPGLNHEWSFGVEGSPTAWREFIQDTPPAFNHEIIASHYRSAVKGDEDHLQLRGNNRHIFQNLRAFQRALDLLRVTHHGGERQ